MVDEKEVQNQLNKKENEQLLEGWLDKDLPSMDVTDIERKCFDPVLCKLLREHNHWVTQVCVLR